MYGSKRIGMGLFLVLSLFMAGFIVSCKKDSSKYEISYTINSSSTWYSDKVEAVIKSDSLLLSGKKDDGSNIAIIVSDNKVGSYPISLTSMQSLVVVNKDGSKDNKTNSISIEGNVSITSNDESKKVISGTFNVKAVAGTSILQPDNITGKFTAKYNKY